MARKKKVAKAHKFDPANKAKLDNSEREAFFDIRQLFEWFGINRGMTVADIGCGTGYCTIPLAARVGGEGTVFAIDISEEMLDEVRKKADRWKVENVVSFRSEESRIPLAEKSIDFVFLSMVIHELEDRAQFFADVERILKKGGRIGIADWEKVDSPSGPPLEERVSREELETFLRSRDFEIIRGEPLGKFHYSILAARREELLSEKIEKVTLKLVDELLCLSERKMRSASLVERFSAVKAETVADILSVLCRKAAEKRTPYVEVLENCIDIERLKEALGLEKMSAIYDAARKKGHEDVVRLLMNPPPQGKRYSEFDFVEGQQVTDITLGHKRSLAKGFNKDTLDRILYDEDLVVIGHILSNPRIVERDVLKIASKRPIKPEILKTVFESEKWISRYVVKRALVLNPCTPTGIALGLVNFMQFQDLKLIATNKTVHEEVRLSAEELLRKNY